MKRMTELLDLYLETGDREKLQENSFEIYKNRMKSIRASELSTEEFVRLSELYNDLYKAEYDFIYLIEMSKKLNELKEDFQFIENEIKEVYDDYSKKLYEKESKVNKNQETFEMPKKNTANNNKKVEKDKKVTENKTNKEHKCNCGGNCGQTKSNEQKKENTKKNESQPPKLEDILGEIFTNLDKNTGKPKEEIKKDLDDKIKKIFGSGQSENYRSDQEKMEKVLEGLFKDFFNNIF